MITTNYRRIPINKTLKLWAGCWDYEATSVLCAYNEIGYNTMHFSSISERVTQDINIHDRLMLYFTRSGTYEFAYTYVFCFIWVQTLVWVFIKRRTNSFEFELEPNSCVQCNVHAHKWMKCHMLTQPCSESGRIRLLHTTYVHFIVSFYSSRLKQRFPTVTGGDLYRR